MNPVTGAVPPLIRGHGIRFEVDRWTWRRLDAARFDGERRLCFSKLASAL